MARDVQCSVQLFVEYSYVLDDSKILFLLNISRVICIKKELSLFFSSYIFFFFFFNTKRNFHD